MKEFNPEKDCVKPTAALHAMDQHKMQRQYPAYIGMDVLENTIAWAIGKNLSIGVRLLIELAISPN